MAENKKRENVAEITGYEAALVKALEAAVRIGLTSDNLYDNISVYNDLYEAGYNFIEKMVLCKYRTNPLAAGVFLFATQLVEQTAFAAFGSVTLLRFQKSCLAEIMQSSAHRGLGQLQFFGDGRDRRPALSILIGSVRKVNIDR